MEFEQMVNVIANYGMSFIITGYFLYRDNKYNETMLTTLTALKETVTNLNETVHRLHKE